MWKVKYFTVVSYAVFGIFFGSLFLATAQGQEYGEELGTEEAKPIVTEVVVPFVQALQAGDVQSIEGLIDGRLAVMLGKLLRENTAYPDFLRRRYGNATVKEPIQVFQDNQVSSTGSEDREKRTAIVQLERPGVAQHNLTLSLEQDGQGHWKVVNQK